MTNVVHNVPKKLNSDVAIILGTTSLLFINLEEDDNVLPSISTRIQNHMMGTNPNKNIVDQILVVYIGNNIEVYICNSSF